ERQQTLRNMIAWSYDLLEPQEKRLFRSLAVFGGGFGIDGATAIENEASADEMLDRLESLVSKNLLRVEAGFDGAPRFFMLATIQEYAQEKLEEAGEQALVKKRYVHFLLTLAQAAEPHLYEADRDAWMQRLDSEDANLQAALASCRDNRDI